MPILVECPACSERYGILPDDWQGREAHCKGCGRAFAIQGGSVVSARLFSVRCPRCGARLRNVSSGLLGKAANCRGCRAVFRIGLGRSVEPVEDQTVMAPPRKDGPDSDLRDPEDAIPTIPPMKPGERGMAAGAAGDTGEVTGPMATRPSPGRVSPGKTVPDLPPHDAPGVPRHQGGRDILATRPASPGDWQDGEPDMGQADPFATRLSPGGAAEADQDPADPFATRLSPGTDGETGQEHDLPESESVNAPADPFATRLAGVSGGPEPASEPDIFATRHAQVPGHEGGHGGQQGGPSPRDPMATRLQQAVQDGEHDPAERPAGEDKAGQSLARGEIILDTYEVLGELGVGGFGMVHHVLHLGWNRELAMKSLKPEVLGRDGVEMFVSEAETWARFGLHPHIVSCYYVREFEGVPRVFAEYVPGGSLMEWIAGGSVNTVERALDIAIQMAWGLEYAHSLGLVHLDMKPHNVMMAAPCTAKVTDFGLARNIHGDRGVSPEGFSLPFASPEQLEKDNPGQESDIWSYALTVLAMFKGEVTWESGSIAPEVLQETVTTGSSLLPVSPALALLLEECFQLSTDKRMSSWKDIVLRLTQLYRLETGKAYAREKPEAGQDSADSLNNLALTHLDLGRPDRAEQCWRKALENDPRHVESAFNMALFSWRRGKLSDTQAVTMVQQAVRDATSPRAHQLLGNLQLFLGEFEDGAESLRAAKKHDQGEDLDIVRDLIIALAAQSGNGPEEWEEINGLCAMVLKVKDDPPTLAARLLADTRLGRDLKLHVFLQRGLLQHYGVDGGPEELFARALPGQGIRKMEGGHAGRITCLALSADGRQAVSADAERSLKWWDVGQGACLRHVEHLPTPVTCAQITPKGDFLVTVCEYPTSGKALDKFTLRVWEMDTGENHSCQDPGAPIRHMAIDSLGQVIITSTGRGADTWDLKTTEHLRSFAGHDDMINAICPFPSAMFATAAGTFNAFEQQAGRDNSIRSWHMVTGEHTEYPGHDREVTALAYSPHHGLLSAGSDHTVRRWDCFTKKQTGIWHWPEEEGGYFTALIPVAKDRILACNIRGAVRSLNLATGEWESVHRMPFSGHDNAPCGLPDGKRLLVPMNRDVGVLDTSYVHPLNYVLSEPVASEEAHSRDRELEALLGAADNHLINGALGEAAAVLKKARELPGLKRNENLLLRCDRLRPLCRMTRLSDVWFWTVLKGHGARVNSVDFTSVEGMIYPRDNVDVLYSGSHDQTLITWDVRKRMRTGEIRFPAWINAVCSFRHGSVAAGLSDRTIHAYLEEEDRWVELVGHSDAVLSLAASRTGSRMISGGADGNVAYWDMDNAQCVRVASTRLYGWANGVALDEEAHLAIIGSQKSVVQAWPMEQGGVLHKRKTFAAATGHKGQVLDVSVRPDGQRTASCGDDATVRIWNTLTGICLKTFTGHEGPVHAVAWLGDAMLASGGEDGTVRIWDAASGEAMHVLRGPRDAVSSLSMSWDRGFLAGASWDGNVYVWYLDWELPEGADDGAPAPGRPEVSFLLNRE